LAAVDEAGGDRYLTILNPDGYSPSPGTIRLVWEDACDIFDGVYMSWDPHHYAHHLTFHGYALRCYQLAVSLTSLQNLDAT
jgi:hypothetical protein